MYQQIADFIKDEFTRQSNCEIDDLDGQVPLEVLNALKAALQKRNSERFKVTKHDALCKQVYELEREWRKRQIREVIELIGEIPRYAIGTEIRDKDHGVSIDKLIDDVLKLPNMAVAEEGHETPETDFKVLNEYTNLRNELIKKCNAIKLGESNLQEKEYQAKLINSLLDAIKESTTSDVSNYFEAYHKRVFTALQDSKYLLEDAIKSYESDSAKRAKLQQLMD
ncbi:hypothetical protein HG537_0A04780 [Torulaspora globosa]|uniref:Uncharacterized protein n=1 Tax=Torulaspora globosa TaxID=48254 RepID=A0A7H9HM11_9SACH|nr:hypothetical protein HG537_0A04780 [Torulaspora sp. CBS 2947]